MKRWLLEFMYLGLVLTLTFACGEGLDSDNRVNDASTPPEVNDVADAPPGFLEEEVEVEVTVEPTEIATSDLPSETVQCNDQQGAGFDTPEIRYIEMGQTSGTFTFSYQTYSQEDRMIVSYNGTELFDTTCLGTGGTLTETISYSGSTTTITVQIIPNCFGGTGTAWNFTVTCPQ